ncbi:hypothetical protein PG984_012066 [Apiospora sp. TS-2023a]
MPQDMPPVGGYGPVQYKRNLPAPGFKPAALVLGMGAVCVWGFWKLGQGIREQNELAREKMWSRIHLIPPPPGRGGPRPGATTHGRPGSREAADGRQLQGLQQRQVRLLSFISGGWSPGQESSPNANPTPGRYVRPTYAVTPANTTK